VWGVYDPDPEHLWNRLFRQFFSRTTNDGQEFGWNSLDPLLWPETTHLLEGASYRQTLQLLDEFLSTGGELLISDPLKRAMFQRDLWAVFDWLGIATGGFAEQREALQEKIALILKKLALTEQEIQSLPDNYTAAVDSGAFPASFQDQDPNLAFLPAGFLEPDGGWVCLGRGAGPIAMTHTEEFPFFGRSIFLVFMRVPGSRDATLSFLQELNEARQPVLPGVLEVALVRRALLIDTQGGLVLSPIVESIQIRHFRPTQTFYEFELDRTLLFNGFSGGLQPVDKVLMLFRSHGDGFLAGYIEEAQIPELCKGCHIDEGMSILGVTSILSYSRARFPLPDGGQPVLAAATPEQEAQALVAWKTGQESWQKLQTLWHSKKP
jgi:hypothetical protein